MPLKSNLFTDGFSITFVTIPIILLGVIIGFILDSKKIKYPFKGGLIAILIGILIYLSHPVILNILEYLLAKIFQLVDLFYNEKLSLVNIYGLIALSVLFILGVIISHLRRKINAH